MERQLLIFISSLISELYNERESIKKTLESIPLTQPWLFEYSPASTSPLEESYLEKVRECDIFILVLGENISLPVQKEWETAVTLNKPRLVFIKRGKRSPQTGNFIDAVDVKWAGFASTDELVNRVREAVIDELITGYRTFRLQPEDLTLFGNLKNTSQKAKPIKTGDTITANIGDNAKKVAVGKNIIQVDKT